MSTHQIFIASYHKDFPWLELNLRSLRKFARGFLPPVICTDIADAPEARRLVADNFPEARVVIHDGRKGKHGFIRAQIAMMKCDILAPEADYIYLLGSDCFTYREFTPAVYWHKSKPVMLFNRYEEIGPQVEPWRLSTIEVLGLPSYWETMRRLPIVYPKPLYGLMRAHVEAHHKMDFEDYLYKKGLPFSESNLLGTFAREKLPQAYTWIHANSDLPEFQEYQNQSAGWNANIQWWSHGGLHRPSDACVEYRPGKNTVGQTPAAVMTEILGP